MKKPISISVLLLLLCLSSCTDLGPKSDLKTVEPTSQNPVLPTSKVVTPPTPNPSTPSTTITTTPTLFQDCTEGWTRLEPGMIARVVSSTGLQNRLRSEPKLGTNITALIDPGIAMKLISGPICADGLVFWSVESPGFPQGVGWTAEGDGKAYFLEPYPYSTGYKEVSFKGVQFIVPGTLAEKIDSQWMDATPLDKNAPYFWEIHPEYLEFTLEGYAISGSFFCPAIKIFSSDRVMDYWGMDSNDLQQRIENGTSPGISMYPPATAPKAFSVKIKLLSFQNGKGFRAVYQWNQAAPATNDWLVYVYEGLTNDGKHILSITMPIHSPYLLMTYDDPELPQGGIPFNIDDWKNYSRSVGEQLGKADDNTFIPTLDILDTLVQSIYIAP